MSSATHRTVLQLGKIWGQLEPHPCWSPKNAYRPRSSTRNPRAHDTWEAESGLPSVAVQFRLTWIGQFSSRSHSRSSSASRLPYWNHKVTVDAWRQLRLPNRALLLRLTDDADQLVPQARQFTLDFCRVLTSRLPVALEPHLALLLVVDGVACRSGRRDS